VLNEQLDVIANSGIALPVIVHCRNAYPELISIFRATQIPPDRFVFHCFTGDESDARLVLEFGAWISFTGIVTFKNAREVQKAAQIVPDDRIMIETDAPFLTPEPYRKVRPNEPQFAIHTARFVAQLRHTSWDRFHETINENTSRFFGIPDVSQGTG
jgi:TatD DNase family protein